MSGCDGDPGQASASAASISNVPIPQQKNAQENSTRVSKRRSDQPHANFDSRFARPATATPDRTTEKDG